MAYRHPGQLFLDQQGPIQEVKDVVHYGDFLRSEARLNDIPPIDLDCIRQAFGLPAPFIVGLQGQQGFLFNENTGQIFINEDDPHTRQRFSYAHELIELLFAAQQEQYPKIKWNPARKEQLCEFGAAALLMPITSFKTSMMATGVHLEGASLLAGLYQTSLLATLVHMIHQCTSPLILILWRNTHKPSDQPPNPNHLSFSLIEEGSGPQKKLRVWWAVSSPSATYHFIPKYKSVSDESCIYKAYYTNSLQQGNETNDFGSKRLTALIEAKRVSVGTERCVVSLLHLEPSANKTLALL